MKNGRRAGSATAARAVSRHSSIEPVGATKANSSRAAQKCPPSSRAAAAVAVASVPVTTTAPRQRGWSAQANPIQIAASMTPSRASTSGIRA